MQDEMDNQDTMISRLNKEKKQLQDSNQKTAEDLQVKFMWSEKTTKNMTKFPFWFENYYILVKFKSTDIFHPIFVAFSEYMIL